MRDLVAVGPVVAGLVLLPSAVIARNITNVGKAASKLNPMVHEAAVQALLHAATHGDYTLVGKLVGGNVDAKTGKVIPGVLGKDSIVRVQGLKVWFQEFSPLRWNGDGKLGIQKDVKLATPDNVERANAANATPFWELSAADEKTAKPLDTAAIFKLIQGFNKRIETQEKDGVLSPEDAAKSKALVAKLSNVKAG